MPDGVTHFTYFKKGYKYSIPISLVTGYLDTRFGVGYLVGYSLGRWCDPDWDIMGSNAAEGRMVNEIPILGHLMYGVSSTYGSVFRKRHRSFITHFPYISTLIRLIFLFIIPFTILDGYGVNLIGNGWHTLWIGLWAGLAHADGLHWYLDNNSDYYGKE